jgi:hypothetical protein
MLNTSHLLLSSFETVLLPFHSLSSDRVAKTREDLQSPRNLACLLRAQFPFLLPYTLEHS